MKHNFQREREPSHYIVRIHQLAFIVSQQASSILNKLSLFLKILLEGNIREPTNLLSGSNNLAIGDAFQGLFSELFLISLFLWELGWGYYIV